MGVCKAGYSIKDEAPIFLIVFAVPAAASALYSIRSVPRLYDLYSSNPQPAGGNVGPWNTPNSRPPPSHTSTILISTAHTAASASTPLACRSRNCGSSSATTFHCERSKTTYAASAAARDKSSSRFSRRTKEPATWCISFARRLEDRLIGIDPFTRLTTLGGKASDPHLGRPPRVDISPTAARPAVCYVPRGELCALR